MMEDKCKKCKRFIDGVCHHPGRDSTITDDVVPHKMWVDFKIKHPNFKDYCSDAVIEKYKKWIVQNYLRDVLIDEKKKQANKLPEPNKLYPWPCDQPYYQEYQAWDKNLLDKINKYATYTSGSTKECSPF